MATGPELFAKALELDSLAEKAHRSLRPNEATFLILRAQVHATLAQAAATAMGGYDRMPFLDVEAWDKVCGVQEEERNDPFAPEGDNDAAKPAESEARA